ncbi:TetR family transcriptional regulator [Pseudonocardia spinosispora]|uniref:TetR/AcrR family transcriptional regulator n=1 Tax=Pseudonocardia spinosispora TaxID=103441 RepID=UPI000562DB20|nr:TetR family transcriptional regulator [Pseudonocardia spinosispora]
MSGRARRSDETRAAILTAARERFAADGYERATIRAIAADAHIDPAMVMRYYVSKERLFAEAARLDLRLPDLSEQPRHRVGELLVRHMLARWEGDETMVAMLRAGATNTSAAATLRTIFLNQLIPVVATVCPEPGQAAVRSGLIASQVLGLAVCRYILHLPPVVDMTIDEVALWIGATLQRYLVENP